MKTIKLSRFRKIFVINQNIESSEDHEKYFIQYLITFIVAMSMFGCGMQLSWFGPALPILNDETKSPIPDITTNESVWINSFLPVGAIPGAILGSLLANFVGRKYGLILTIIPNAINYLLIIYVQNVNMLYAARFFSGLNNGITFVIVPIYITEISSPKVRGIMGTFATIMLSFSWILQFAFMPLMTLQLNSILTLVIIAFQCVATFFIPEAPLYYLMKGKDRLAERSLQILRQRCNVDAELLYLKEGRDIQNRDKVSFWKNIQTKVIRKGMLILGIPMLACQFNAGLTLIGYLPTIMNESIPVISSYVGGIILVSSYLLGTVGSTLFIDNYGRRPLFVVSCISTCVLASLTGLYFHFQWLSIIKNIAKYSAVLFALLMTYLFVFSFGLFSMPHIFVGELFGTNFRPTASLLLSMLNSVVGFTSIQLFERIKANYGLQYVFWMYAFVTLLYAILGYFFLPETKGKTLTQIQIDLTK